MNRVELHNDIWSLELIPEWGGRVALLKAGGLGIMTPIEADHFDPLAWPKGGIYPLMPYSNRVRHARLVHAGTVHELPAHPATFPHTLHGVAHTLPWRVSVRSEEHITLTCEYEGEHWPWPVRFEQSFALEGNQLRLDLGVINLGRSSMPAGIGLHPYFHRHAGMRVELSVGNLWDIDAEYLPTGSVRPQEHPIVLEDNLQRELALYGSEWDGLLKVHYPRGQLLVEAKCPLSHVVIFAPLDAPYLCLEPVSHLADAFNAPPSEWSAQGTQVLEPGQALTATLTFSWLPR
jgi:aldose 1-epimerase